MQTTTTIGLDIAKSVFQVHGVDAAGQVVIRRQLKRRYVVSFSQKLPQCLIGIEACASSHHWSREPQALGHTVRLMPPAYVKRQKNDATDAEAICEAKRTCQVRTMMSAQRAGAEIILNLPSISADDPMRSLAGPKFPRCGKPLTDARQSVLTATSTSVPAANPQMIVTTNNRGSGRDSKKSNKTMAQVSQVVGYFDNALTFRDTSLSRLSHQSLR
jgi:hypothetical protein